MPKYSLTSWSKTHAILMLISSAYAIWNGASNIIVFTALASFGYVLWINKSSALNWPNFITGFRLLLICGGILLALRLSIGQLFILLLIAVLLDVVDGYVARKSQKETQLGFYLDMEVDALFVLLMSFYFYQLSDVHVLVLLPGLLRYLYKLMTTVIHRPSFEESKKPYASIIAGSYFVILLARMRLPGLYMDYILLLGGLLICISFGASFVEYLFYVKKDSSAELPVR